MTRRVHDAHTFGAREEPSSPIIDAFGASVMVSFAGVRAHTADF